MKTRYIILVFISCIASFLYGRYTKRDSNVPVADTIVLVDTVRDSFPLPVYETVVQSVPELFPVYITLQGDTVREPIFVPVPITQRSYQTDDYKLSISGYNAHLDYIEIYRQSRTVTKVAQPRRWGIGVMGGYGIGRDGLSPFIGIGGFYRVW